MTAHYRLPAQPLPSSSTAVAAPAQTNSVQAVTSLYRDGVKRVLDTLIVIVSAPVTLPLVLFLALLVMRSGGNPFYRQARVGRGGRLYTMWKLRSMVPDADTKLEAHLASDPAARKEWDTTQKLKADPRITPFGQFLRRSSLDELPQLWNVLRGDMSLVGPRPMMPEQAPLYPGEAYYTLRPGITGLWQISERNETTFADRAHYDTRYGHDISLLTDIRILAATFRVVLRGTGY